MKTNKLHVSIPYYYKEVIDAAFNTITKKELNKIYFLVQQINESRRLDISASKWSDGLSITRGEICNILDVLRQKLNIIKVVDLYQKGVKSFTYSMVRTYDYKRDYCYVITYDTTLAGCPKWVEKYINNNGHIYSNKNLIPKKSDNVVIQDLHNTIAAQAKEIEELKELLKYKNTHIESKANSAALQSARPIEVEAEVSKPMIAPNVATPTETYKEFDYEGDQIIIHNYNYISSYTGIDYLLFDIDMGVKGENKFTDKEYTVRYHKAIKSTYNGNVITATILN